MMFYNEEFSDVYQPWHNNPHQLEHEHKSMSPYYDEHLSNLPKPSGCGVNAQFGKTETLIKMPTTELPIASSWYMAIRDIIRNKNWPIEEEYVTSKVGSGGFYIFFNKEADYRTISFVRRYNTYPASREPNPTNPPFIWACWSHWLTPPLQGYFEETLIEPNPDGVKFMAEIFQKFLLESLSTVALKTLAKENHPKFFEELEEDRRPKNLTPAQLFSEGLGM